MALEGFLLAQYPARGIRRIRRAYRFAKGFEATGLVSTDALFTRYARKIAGLVANRSGADGGDGGDARSGTVLYQFTKVPKSYLIHAKRPHCTVDAACHAADNVFLFGTHRLIGANMSALDLAIGETIRNDTASFAYGTDSEAPRFQWGKKASIAYGGVAGNEVAGVVWAYRGRLCDMWDAVYDS